MSEDGVPVIGAVGDGGKVTYADDSGKEKPAKTVVTIVVDQGRLRAVEFALFQLTAIMKAAEDKINSMCGPVVGAVDPLVGIALEKIETLREKIEALYDTKDAEVQPLA